MIRENVVGFAVAVLDYPEVGDGFGEGEVIGCQVAEVLSEEGIYCVVVVFEWVNGVLRVVEEVGSYAASVAAGLWIVCVFYS